MNGGERPGRLSTVHKLGQAPRPYVSIFYQPFAGFFGPLKIVSHTERISILLFVTLDHFRPVSAMKRVCIEVLNWPY